MRTDHRYPPFPTKFSAKSVPKLNDLAIRHALPGSMLWDDDLQGFGLRTGKTAKTFVVLVGSGRRYKLGRYPLLSLAKARDKAREKLAEILLGADHKPIAVDTLKERFLAEAKSRVRPRTYDGYTWLLGRFTLKGDAGSITARKLSEEIDKLAPSVREHVTAAYKMLFRFAVRKGYLKHSPVAGFVARPSKPRERTLSPDEVKAVWHACPDSTFGTVVKLLILTGQRRNEIQHIAVVDDFATIKSAFTKNRRSHTFPVGERTKELLTKCSPSGLIGQIEVFA